jgi:hypothetical protein
MQATKQQLDADLAAAVKFFKTDLGAKELPFMGDYFPKNSCESASSILAAALATRYPESKVQLVHGLSPKNDNHYWVEVDDRVLDATADQFPTCPAPFVCPIPSPLAMEYSDITREIPSVALSNRVAFLQRSIEELNALVARLRSRLDGRDRSGD